MQIHIRKHFQHVDPVLFQATQYIFFDDITPAPQKMYFSRLTRSIIGQQLSGKVADIIWCRFEQIFAKKDITSDHVATVSDKDLRVIGLSESKTQYIKNLAHALQNKSLIFDDFESLDDEAIIKRLTSVKGIGPWTAEMFLIFTLGRQDIFSFGDLGLKKAIQNIYTLKKLPDTTFLKDKTYKWSPFRSYASRLLWKTLE